VLGGLEVDGDPRAAVRAAFDRSYERLPPDGRRLFRLVALVPGATVTAGRVGDAITFTFVNEAVFRTTLIVDPRTGSLLSKSNALVDPGVEAR
jgi:hypothetical protein